MNLCPRCKEPMPPLSKVCPVCGYTDTTGQTDGGENRVSESLTELENRLSALRSLPEATYFEGIRSFLFLVYPVALLCMIVLAAAWGNLLLWGLVLLLLILSIVEVVQKLRGKRAADGQTSRINARMQQTIQERTAHIRKTKICGAGITAGAIVLLLLIGWGGVSMALSFAREATATHIPSLLEEKRYDEAAKIYVEQYALTPDNTSSVAVRMQMVQSMVSAAEFDRAQDFFMDFCMGNPGDYDCACVIVQGLKLADKSDVATNFVSGCKDMRFKSDISRLKQLLNK